MEPLQHAGLFLVKIIFDFYIFILLLRIILQKFRIDFFNPFSQTILKLTNPPLLPVRRYLPVYAGFDSAAISFMILLQLLKFMLLIALTTGATPEFAGLFIIVIADILSQVVNVFFYAILLVVIISWVTPMSMSPLNAILSRLTEPLLQPARRLIPQLGGLDLSPMVVMVLLQLINIIIVNPLTVYGRNML